MQNTAFVDAAEASSGDDPSSTWDRLVGELIQVTVENRAGGGLYRWEGRYLELDDRRALNDQIELVNRRVQQTLSRLRPHLSPRDRWRIASSVLSVIGSITDHRAQLAPEHIRRVLGHIAADIRDTDLPRDTATDEWASPMAVGSAAGEYEQILHEAMVLFRDRGYRDAGMDDIAAAANLPTTSLYRFFSGKGAILAATYRRAADRLSCDVSTILAATDDPEDAICQLIDAYSRRSLANPEIAYVYYAERNNIPAEDRVALRNIRQATVQAWVRLVVASRPTMSHDEAHFAVHAAFGLIVDLGRLMHSEHNEAVHAVVSHLARTTLLENPRR